jgi:hypothetical protein
MASTYTTNLGIEKIGTGEQSGTWGDTTNTNFDILDEAINGIISVTLSSAGSSGSPTALPITDGASSNGRNKFIEFVDGGDLGGTAYVQLTPNNAEKVVHIRNSLSSSRSVIVFQGTYNASNDFEIVNGADVLLKFNGGGSGATVTDVNVDLTVTGATIATADINGGTIDGAVIGGASAAAGTFTTITGTTITASTAAVPDASDGATLGSASLEWSDLYLADGAVVFFGDDQDITLTHVADTGLTLKHANTGDDKFPTFLLATGDTDIAANDKLGVINFQAPDEGAGTDAILVAAGIEAVSEGDFSASSNATSLVFKTGASEAAAEKMRISSAGDLAVGSASNHAGARVVINDTPPTAFGSPMFQVGQETFTSSGIYSIGFGFTNGTYTEPPAEIAAVSTSSSGGTTADIIFGTRSVTTNTAVTERMRIDGDGQIMIQGATAGFDTTAAKNGLQLYYETDTGLATLGSYSSGGSTLMTFHTNSSGGASAERMRIDSSGQVGIGTTSPDRDFQVETAGDTYLRIAGNRGDANDLHIGNVEFENVFNSVGVVAEIKAITGNSGTQSAQGQLAFYTDDGSSHAERMRIDSSGNLLVSTTSSTVDSSNFGTRIGGTSQATLKSFRDAGAGSACSVFGGNAGQARVMGDGDLENTNNSYGSVSDARLKSNIVDASSQIDDIMAVQVRSYTLNETGATHIGVVAQELEASGMSGLVKTDEEDMKSVKYSILYMKAIKALQEAVTRIETLEAEVAALKGE